jgi:hypothetical protein
MARKKARDNQVAVGNTTDVSREVNIAAGNVMIYKGYSSKKVSVLLNQITSTFQVKPFDRRCPYKGLDAFAEEDAEFFFGREALVEDLVPRGIYNETDSRISNYRLSFVIRASPSGRSGSSVNYIPSVRA